MLEKELRTASKAHLANTAFDSDLMLGWFDDRKITLYFLMIHKESSHRSHT